MERLTTLFRGLAPFRPSSNPIHKCSALKRRPQSIQSRQQPFSTTQVLQKRKKGQKKDYRITNIRYHLKHPLTPRPLRFSRTRFLRHWTIHRAWQLYQSSLRKTQELQLERQYNSMREACELLRVIGRDGIVGGEQEGRLFRRAMEKRGVWSLKNGGKEGGEEVVGVPIEYARLQTEWPSLAGWNHEWRRG